MHVGLGRHRQRGLAQHTIFGGLGATDPLLAGLFQAGHDLLDLATVLAQQHALEPFRVLTQFVGIPHHGEVVLLDAAQAHAPLLGHVLVEAVEQYPQMLACFQHIGVGHGIVRCLTLHDLHQFSHLAGVQAVDGPTEQVVVLAHAYVAVVQVAVPLGRRAILTRVGHQDPGQLTGRRAGAVLQDRRSRQHRGSRPLGEPINGAGPLGHPGTLVQMAGQRTGASRGCVELAALEGVQQVNRTLVIAHHHEHTAQELAHLLHQGLAWGVRQLELTGHGELVDVGQTLFTVGQLLQRGGFVPE